LFKQAEPQPVSTHGNRLAAHGKSALLLVQEEVAGFEAGDLLLHSTVAPGQLDGSLKFSS